MTALLLAGGLGTRLRSVVADRPKVLADVRNRPFLAFLLDQLVDAGIGRVTLCVGHLGEQISELFGNAYRGVELHYSQERTPLGTAGALRHALSSVAGESLLVMNGDSYCSADLSEFADWHRDRGVLGSMLLTHVPDTRRYGQVRVAESDRVGQFAEKDASVGSGWINAGIYILHTTLLAEIPAGRPVSLEREMLPDWIRRPFGAFRSESRFLDIGVPESYAQAEAFFNPALQKSA
jgi:NDP-sugar pyrophosphorylase family protein